MIKFKTLKWKHKRRAEELSKQINTNEADEEDILFFVLGLVETWDFKDAENGEPLSLATATAPDGRDYYPCMDEMTLEQYVEVMSMFNRRMGVEESDGVKKTKDAPSSYGSTQSKAVRRPARRPPGGLKTSS